MRPVDVALAAALALTACRAPGNGPDAPPRDEPGPASAPATTASPTPAPTTSAPSAAESAAVAAACKEFDDQGRMKHCVATHHFGDFILFEVLWIMADGYGLSWYAVQRQGDAYRLLKTAYDPPGGEETVWSPDELCDTDALADGARIPGTGIVRAEMRDLSLDGRDDLLVECRSESSIGGRRTEGHYLKYCLGSRQACDEPVWLKKVEGGRVKVDVDVQFVDGWIRRTVRVFAGSGPRGDIQLSETPPPRAGETTP
jgi:hypothetical protein